MNQVAFGSFRLSKMVIKWLTWSIDWFVDVGLDPKSVFGRIFMDGRLGFLWVVIAGRGGVIDFVLLGAPVQGYGWGGILALGAEACYVILAGAGAQALASSPVPTAEGKSGGAAFFGIGGPFTCKSFFI